jgi:hypothetical protein
MPTVYVHITSEDAIVGEIEDLPQKSDTVVLVKNPRRKDGKDISYLEPSVTHILLPMHRITFIEILPGAEEDQIISFVRE